MSSGGYYSSWTTTELLQLFQYAQHFADYPKNTLPPGFSNPNYVAPDIGSRVSVTAIVTCAIALAVVFARLWTRRFQRARVWGFDDWLISLAMIFLIGFTITEVLVVRRGCVGKHSYDCHLSQLKYSFTFQYASLVLYLLGIFLVKFSILWFIYRLTEDTDIWMRRICLITAICIVCFFFGIFFMVTFGCRPFSATWSLQTRLDGPYKCLPIQKVLVGWAVIYALTDVWLLFLPAHVIWKLHMPTRTKLGLIFVFSLGLTATVAAFVKAKTVYIAYNTYDAAWAFVPVLISSHLEMTFGLIAACVPALNFWLIKLGPRLMSPFSSLSGLRFSPTKYLIFWKRSGSSERTKTTAYTGGEKGINRQSAFEVEVKSEFAEYVSTVPPAYLGPEEAYFASSKMRNTPMTAATAPASSPRFGDTDNNSYNELPIYHQMREQRLSPDYRSSSAWTPLTRPESEYSVDLVIQRPRSTDILSSVPSYDSRSY